MAIANWKNQTIWTGDNLDIMRGMNSESVDLIYLDPPFNSNRTYSAPIGSEAAGAAFKDTWTLSDVDLAWIGIIAEKEPNLSAVIDAAGLAHGKGMKSYLVMMAVRLIEMRRVMKPTASIYLHCDDTASHWIRVLMEAIFGRTAFRNEVVWKRVSNHNDAGRFGRTADRLLFFGSAINRSGARVPLSAAHAASKYRHKDKRGWHADSDLTGSGLRDGESGEPWRGYDPSRIGRHWGVPSKGAYAQWIDDTLVPGYKSLQSVCARLDALSSAGLIHWTKNGTPRLKRYLSASPGQVPPDVWSDIPPVNSQAKERTGYPTQKPLALLDRIIRASSNEGDMVLDPFCGCATTCIAAEKLGRQWTGIDISPKAAELVKVRMRRETNLFDRFNPIVRTDIPKRTDVGKLPPYKTHKHTLYGKQEGKCAGCPHHFPFQNFTIDHILAKSRGGTDHLENLQLLCSHCNSLKGTMDQAAFTVKLKNMGLRP